MASSDNDHDETEIRFQEMHGARICRKGGPRNPFSKIKEPPHPLQWMHEARLRGYDWEKAALAKKRDG